MRPMQTCLSAYAALRKKIKSRPEATALGDAMVQRLKTPFQCVRPLLVKALHAKIPYLVVAVGAEYGFEMREVS